MARKKVSSIIQRQRERVTHEGRVWWVTYKIFPEARELRVYRVEGDVSQPDVLREGLQAFADERGLAMLMVRSV